MKLGYEPGPMTRTSHHGQHHHLTCLGGTGWDRMA